MTQILVVDNNPVVLDFIKEVLSSDERKVTVLSSGLEALEWVKHTVPDIVFVDLIMPQIDGKELCALLRNNDRTRDCFITIISAIAAEDRDFDFTGLADAYLAKIPFKKMRGYLLKLVDDFEQGRTDHYKEGIVGLEEIYNREITRELLFSKRHMEMLLSSISDGFVELSEDGKIIFVNDAALDIFGIQREELLTVYLPDLFDPDTGEAIKTILQRMNGEELVLGNEEEVLLRDRNLNLRFNTVRYGEFRSINIILQDITDQRKAERIIKEDLEKKEALLKEVHHRVKNNLNVIASLLSLQTSFVEDALAKEHLTDSKSRVESMALIHEKLYHTEDLSGIYLDTYLEDLAAHLIDTYSSSRHPIRSYMKIPSLHIKLEAAVPLGLIVNELITNSLEHGLKDHTEGKVELSLSEDEVYYCLTIHDNGPGLPGDFDLQKIESLGLMLVQNLCQQIGAEFSIASKEGTAATLCFRKESRALIE